MLFCRATLLFVVVLSPPLTLMQTSNSYTSSNTSKRTRTANQTKNEASTSLPRDHLPYRITFARNAGTNSSGFGGAVSRSPGIPPTAHAPWAPPKITAQPPASDTAASRTNSFRFELPFSPCLPASWAKHRREPSVWKNMLLLSVITRCCAEDKRWLRCLSAWDEAEKPAQRRPDHKHTAAEAVMANAVGVLLFMLAACSSLRW